MVEEDSFTVPSEMKVRKIHVDLSVNYDLKELMMTKVGSRNLSIVTERLWKEFILADDPNAETYSQIDKQLEDLEKERMEKLVKITKLKMKKKELMNNLIPIKIGE